MKANTAIGFYARGVRSMLRRRRWTCLILVASLSSLFIVSIRYLSPSNNETILNESLIHCSKNKPWSAAETYRNLVYIPQLEILFCDVPKAASTNVRRLIYHYLHPSVVSSSSANLNRKAIWIDHEEFFRSFYLNRTSHSIVKNEKSFKFLLVRHPFRRIHSTFLDKFVHNHLDDTLSGWKQYEEEILLRMKPKETLLSLRRKQSRLDLSTFLRSIILSIREGLPINSHWQQIVSRCAVCLVHYDWIGKIESLHENGQVLMNRLNKHIGRNQLKFPSEDLDRTEKDASRFDDEQLVELFRQSLANEDHFETLLNYYRDDFQIFNYSLPHLRVD